MKVYSIDVRKDIMEPKNIVIPAGNAKLHKLQFTFDDAWHGLPKVCQFSSGGKAYPVILENDGCIIPSDMATTPGAFCFGVYGYETGSEVGTSDLATLKIRISTNLLSGLIVDGAYSGTDDEVTPTLFEQLGTVVQKHVDDRENPHKVTAEQIGALTWATGDERYLRNGHPFRYDAFGALTGDVLSANLHAESGITVSSTGQMFINCLMGVILDGQLSVPAPNLEDSATNKKYVDENIADAKMYADARAFEARDYADSKIPTKVSQLTNDRGYINETAFDLNMEEGSIEAQKGFRLQGETVAVNGDQVLNLTARDVLVSGERVSLEGSELSNVGTPTAGSSAANKSYVDSKYNELNAKATANTARIAAMEDTIGDIENTIGDIENTIGDIDTALDTILTIQAELTGGATA